MLQLQYRAFQNHPGTQLPFPLFCIGNKYGQCSQLKFRKNTTTNSPKGTRDFFLFGSLSNGSKGALSIHSQLKSRNNFSYLPLDNGVGLSSNNCESFSKRCFSQVPRVTNGSGKMGDGRNGDFAFRLVNKHRKWASALAARGKNIATEDVNAVNSANEQQVGYGMEGVELGSSTSNSSVSNSKQDSKVSRKRKRQSRSKKNKEQVSATIDAEQTSVAKSSKRASQAKSSNSKSGQSMDLSLEVSNSDFCRRISILFLFLNLVTLQFFQTTSVGSTPEQALDGSALTKQQSKKKSGSSSRKTKSVRAANASLQRQSPQEVVIAKPRGQNTTKLLYPPTGKSVVVVESVTKAKVIQGYLGDIYEVLPSYGHVRDLAARSGSVRPDDDFSMVWEVPSAAWTHLKSIKVALNGYGLLFLSVIFN